MPTWIRTLGRAFVRGGLAMSPQAYAAACANPGVTPDATYCGPMTDGAYTNKTTGETYTVRGNDGAWIPRKSRREARREREAREIEAERKEYACGDWPDSERA